MITQNIEMDSKDFEPLSEYFLVSPEKLLTEKITEGGLIIPLVQKTITGDRPTSGIVIAGISESSYVKVGDFVIWPETDGLDLEFNDGKFLLLKTQSIIGKKKNEQF